MRLQIIQYSRRTGLLAVYVAAAVVLRIGEAAPAQQAYLKASNSAASNYFGFAVAASGDTVVVGAYGEGSHATGINGNQRNNRASAAGAAYVFARNGTIWAQQAYLKASNTESGDMFGRSVAISGDTVVVGAAAEDSNATGVNGNQSDNSVDWSGAAYVFVRSGTNWSQQAYLKASNTKPANGFGEAVAVSGDTLIVGAYGEPSKASGVNGNQNDTSARGAGAAYVFVRNGTSWTQQAYLKASNPDIEDGFGRSVAVWANTVVVGAWWEDSKATGVNGDQVDNSKQNTGAAYVFVRNGTNWTQQAYLKASNPGVEDSFGKSVAVSGDTVVIGAENERSDVVNSGAAYVFVREGTNWSQQAYLKAPRPRANVHMAFGTSVAVSGNTMVAGAVGEASGASGINGDQNNTNAPSSGAAYVFVRNGTNWSQQYYLKASNPDGCGGRVYVDFLGRLKSSSWGTCDQFGWSVGVSGDTVIVGAIGEASKATGVNGNQSDNSAKDAGAAYVFGGFGSGSPTPPRTGR